jgi:hypothetical protein
MYSNTKTNSSFNFNFLIINFVYKVCRLFKCTHIESVDINPTILKGQTSNAILWFIAMFLHTSVRYRKAQTAATVATGLH